MWGRKNAEIEIVGKRTEREKERKIRSDRENIQWKSDQRKFILKQCYFDQMQVGGF